MIYSRWKPSGGYDYFEAGAPAPLGDDLPVPSFYEIGNIGAPSTDIGRPMPADAKFVGSGKTAVGLIVPMVKPVKSQLQGDDSSRTTMLPWFGLGAAVLGAAWVWKRWGRA